MIEATQNKLHFSIRMVNAENAEQIIKIYAPYVSQTAISFEDVIPSVDEMQNRISGITNDYPWLVAVDQNLQVL